MSWQCAAIVGLAAVLGPVGCSEVTEPDPDEPNPDDPMAAEVTEPDPNEPMVAEIVIPMRPRESGELYGTPQLVESADGPRMQLMAISHLALGEGYPRDFTATVPRRFFASCGIGEGSIALTQLGGDSEVVTAQLASPTAIELRARSAGHTILTGSGTVSLETEWCDLPAGSTLPFDLEVTLAIERAENARIEPPCPTAGTPVAPSSRASEAYNWSWFSATLVDEAGQGYLADNAEPDAQVSVTLHGSFDPDHAAPSTLTEWITPPRPGPVEIVPAFGEPLTVEVVEPARITDIELEFQLAGTASGPTTLADDETYGAQGWGRAANRIAPMIIDALHTDPGPLCSAPSTAWFDLESLTPEICSIVDLPALEQGLADGYTLFGDRTGQAARLEQAGTCALVLHAPMPFAEDEVLATLTADFADPTGLHEL